MIDDIALSRLHQIAILSEGDFHDLAAFLLRGYDAYKTAIPGTIGRRRPTPNSVARKFVALFPEVDLRKVVDTLVKARLPLDAAIGWDDELNQRRS